MEYGFSSQVHIYPLYSVCDRSPDSATQMKVRELAAFSMQWMGCSLTKLHNTAMAFIPTTMSGRESCNINKKLNLQHILMLTSLHHSQSPTDDIIFNNVPGYTHSNCYPINYPQTVHRRATRLMTKINVDLSFLCSQGMVDLELGFLTKRFLPLNCDHF